MNIGKVEPIEIIQEMQRSYLDYAMSVIVSRALPDVRDGLKPVHRRILYAMHQMGLHFSGRHTKSAKVVGEVLGKYHPHGDMAVYDALVRMAQTFSIRYPLIFGQGNFGSVDGDPPAAMRYTEVKLAKITEEMLSDIEKETVPMRDNFDGTLQEPVFLPAKLPNLLLMGAEGIAVGMATKIPPHNLGEVIDAVIFMIDGGLKNGVNAENFSSQATIEELMEYIKGPDFPTGGAIYDVTEIRNAYTTGRGKIINRGIAEIEDIGQGKSAIIITEIPYLVNKATLVAKIARLVKDKKVRGITDLRDESDRRGIRVVVELKRDSRPRSILNNLYKYTELQTSFPVNSVALVGETPQTLNLKIILEEYIRHRQEIVRKRSEFELKEAKARAHILEGLKIAVDNIDAVIETIKKAKDVEEAKINLIKKFSLSAIQAQAILDMQLKRLAALERQKIEDELLLVHETIAYLEDLLLHPQKILKIIKDELLRIKEKYADARKTRVFKSKASEFSEEELIADQPTIVTLTEAGYIKRQPQTSFKVQNRGGKGVIGMTTKEEDRVVRLISANTHDSILFFTNSGRVYQTRVWEVPEGSRTAKGMAIVNMINTDSSEKVTSVLTYDQKESKKEKTFIFMATRLGQVKKTKLKEYQNIRKSGLIAIKLEKGDELCWVRITNGTNEIILTTCQGKSIRFLEKQVRPMGRDTQGVRGIKLGKDDLVAGMEVISEENKNCDFLVIMENGLGKKTLISAFPKQGRGGKGVKVAQITRKTGNVVRAQLIPCEAKNLLLTSKHGQIVRVPIEAVPKRRRATQGVILMRFSNKEDLVATATCID